VKKKSGNLLQLVHDKQLIVKSVVILLVAVISLFLIIFFVNYLNSIPLAVLLGVSTGLLLLFVFVKKTRIYSYLLPAALILLIFSGFPILFTTVISFTNFKVGHVISRTEALDNLLTTQWHVDKSYSPYYAEVYAPYDVINRYDTLYQQKMSPLDRQLDAVIDADLSEKVEDVIWNRRDKVELAIIQSTFESLSLEDLLIILYPEQEIEYATKKKKNIKVFIYHPGSADGTILSCKEHRLQDVDTFTSGMICIGNLVYKRPGVENFEQIELTLLPEYSGRLMATGNDEYIQSPLVLPEGSIYRLDYGNRFLVKVPRYRKVDQEGGVLEQLVVADDGSYKYSDQLIFADDFLGSYVTTTDNKPAMHWQEFRIKTPEYRVAPWFWYAYGKSLATGFLDMIRLTTGLNEDIRSCFPGTWNRCSMGSG
jgi:hypothetical protein